MINAPSSLGPKNIPPPPTLATNVAPAAVTDATQPVGLQLESKRDQSASLLKGEESWPSHSSLSGRGTEAAQGYRRGKRQATGSRERGHSHQTLIGHLTGAERR